MSGQATNLTYLSWSSLRDSAGRKVSSYTLDLADPGLTAVREHIWNIGANVLWGFFMAFSTVAASFLRWVGDPFFLDKLSELYKGVTAHLFATVNPILVGGIAFTVLGMLIFIDSHKTAKAAGGRVLHAGTFNRVGAAAVLMVGIAVLTMNPFALLRALLSLASSLIALVAGTDPQNIGALSVDFLIRQPTLLITFNGPVNASCAAMWSKGTDISKLSDCTLNGATHATVSTLIMSIIALLMSLAALAFAGLALWKFAKHLSVSVFGFMALGWIAAASMLKRRQFDLLGKSIAISSGHMIMAIVVQVIAIGGPTTVMSLMSAWGQKQQPILQMFVLGLSYLVLFGVLRKVTDKTGVLVTALKADTTELLDTYMEAPGWVRKPGRRLDSGRTKPSETALWQAISAKATEDAAKKIAQQKKDAAAVSAGEPTVVADQSQPRDAEAQLGSTTATASVVADTDAASGSVVGGTSLTPATRSGSGSVQSADQDAETTLLGLAGDPTGGSAVNPVSAGDTGFTGTFGNTANVDGTTGTPGAASSPAPGSAEGAPGAQPAVINQAAAEAAVTAASRNSSTPFVGGMTPDDVIAAAAREVRAQLTEAGEGTRDANEDAGVSNSGDGDASGSPEASRRNSARARIRGTTNSAVTRARSKLDERFGTRDEKPLTITSMGVGLAIRTVPKAVVTEAARMSNKQLTARFPAYQKTTHLGAYAAWKLLGSSATRGDVTATKQTSLVEHADQQVVVENEVRKQRTMGRAVRAIFSLQDHSHDVLFDGSSADRPVRPKNGQFNDSLV